MLGTSDVGRAVRFYVETLGMKLIGERDGSATLDAGEGFRLELRAGAGPGASVLLYPKVPIDEAIAVYENRGVTFDVSRTERSVSATFRDPDGNALTLVQPE